MVLFPIFISVVPDWRAIPSWLLGLIFFASAIPAWLPLISKRAPYTFWLVAIALFFLTFFWCAIVAVTIGGA